MLTLSQGQYPEFFPNDSLRRLGSVLYDTRRRRVVTLLPSLLTRVCDACLMALRL